jgi:hypothetical protein
MFMFMHIICIVFRDENNKTIISQIVHVTCYYRNLVPIILPKSYRRKCFDELVSLYFKLCI